MDGLPLEPNKKYSICFSGVELTIVRRALGESGPHDEINPVITTILAQLHDQREKEKTGG